MNEYFYLIGTARWLDSVNPSLELELTLVYKLKFVSKLEISLTASPGAVARGQSLVLDSSEYEILNIQADQMSTISFTR